MSRIVITIASTALAGILIVAGARSQDAAEPTTRVVPASEVVWEHLNPARGDKSPRAATLWGDRGGTGPTGFLVRFADGFSSPPHIHNVSYRGVVISGLVHNDDPEAAPMWMPPGSFWTQPKGESHITAARGHDNVAYIEIEEGPYLVQPAAEAFDSGERPVNIDVSNLVWVDQPGSSDGPRIAHLWGHPRGDRLRGVLVEIPPGFAGEIHSHGSIFRAVVIGGRPGHRVADSAGARTLEPGSFFGSEGESVHRIESGAGEGSIIYLRTNGRFDVVPK